MPGNESRRKCAALEAWAVLLDTHALVWRPVSERERDGGPERHIVFAYVDGDRSEWLRREQLEVPRPALALQSFPPG